MTAAKKGKPYKVKYWPPHPVEIAMLKKPAPKRRAWRPSVGSVWAAIESMPRLHAHAMTFDIMEKALRLAARVDKVTK